MNVTAQTVDDITIVALEGEIDGRSAPVAQGQIMPLCHAQCKVILDMQQVSYMSSAGLRLMLALHRYITDAKVQGRLVLTGLSEDIQGTMSATGFLSYFTLCATLEEGLAALRQGV